MNNAALFSLPSAARSRPDVIAHWTSLSHELRPRRIAKRYTSMLARHSGRMIHFIDRSLDICPERKAIRTVWNCRRRGAPRGCRPRRAGRGADCLGGGDSQPCARFPRNEKTIEPRRETWSRARGQSARCSRPSATLSIG